MALLFFFVSTRVVKRRYFFIFISVGSCSFAYVIKYDDDVAIGRESIERGGILLVSFFLASKKTLRRSIREREREKEKEKDRFLFAH